MIMSGNSFSQKGNPTHPLACIAISRNDFSKPRCYYGLMKVPQDGKLLQGIHVIPFDIVYQIGYQVRPTPLRQTFLLGFYGFDDAAVNEWDTLWCKPSDTMNAPYMHTLLSDVILKNSGQLGIEDPSNILLLAFDLEKSKTLSDPQKNRLSKSLLLR